MIFLKPHTVISEVLSDHNDLIPILNRFGIKLGVGDNSVEELCYKYSLDTSLLLTVLNVYLHEDYIPDADTLDSFDTELVVDYFNHTTENYINELIPNIEKHLNAFIIISSSNSTYNSSDSVFGKQPINVSVNNKNVGAENNELEILRDLFLKFKNKMTNYLKEFTNYYINMPDELLHDLKNILIKHIPTDYNQNLCYAVIFSINSFEKDICAHNRLRNRVLLPKLNKLDSTGIRQLKQSVSIDYTDKSEVGEHHLTNRETEILCLIVKGYLNKEIADSLNISLNTVLTHRKNIIAKTGIKTVSGLTFYSLRNGLISI